MGHPLLKGLDPFQSAWWTTCPSCGVRYESQIHGHDFICSCGASVHLIWFVVEQTSSQIQDVAMFRLGHADGSCVELVG